MSPELQVAVGHELDSATVVYRESRLELRKAKDALQRADAKVRDLIGALYEEISGQSLEKPFHCPPPAPRSEPR